LNTFDGVGGYWARYVDVYPLNLGTILDGSMFVWFMLCRVGSGVLKLKVSFGNAVGHVKVGGASRIIPINVHAAKEGAVPVHGVGVVFF
jgi:hypothetical protein